AQKHPGDSLAELTLAHAEVRFGDRAAGEAILAARLAKDPRDVDSLRLMAESKILSGEASDDRKLRAQLFSEARPYLGRAFQINGKDFRTLYDYAHARSADPDYPNDNTLNVLLLAVQLAPSVADVRIQAARGLLAHKRPKEAEVLLTPLAFSPHGGG